MGQSQCCESVQHPGSQLAYRFQNMHKVDPVESSQGKLMMSVATSVMTETHGPSTKQGNFTQNRPQLNSQVRKRLQQTSEFRPQGVHLIDRGEEQKGYFNFKVTGVIYRGQWKYGKPFGWGKNYYPNGGYYEGSFIDGVPHGCGRFIMPNGDFYQGDIKFGRANGRGFFITKNGEYKGDFKDNIRHGFGQEKAQNMHFKGTFEYGDKKEGTLQFNDGDIYEGQFENNVPEGKGKLTTTEGLYTGSFRNGLKHGQGEHKWKDGSYYKGSYYEGQREGSGEFFNSKNSSASRGFWKNGIIQGQGEYSQRGKVYKCIWNKGKLVGLRN